MSEEPKPPITTVDPPDLLRTIRDLINSPSFIQQVATARKTKRPLNVSRSSIYTYYQEIYGIEIKIWLDKMIETKQDMEWKFSDYPDYRPKTVYQRVYQGIKYLLENLDPTEHYAKYRSMMILTTEKTGIRLSWDRARLEGRSFSPSVVTLKDRTLAWREEIDKFLEDRSSKSLHLKRLSLNTEQIQDLENSFAGIDGISYLVLEKEIKIVKTDPGLYDEPDESSTEP